MLIYDTVIQITFVLHSSEDSGCPYFLVLKVIQVRHIHIPQSDLWVGGSGLKGIRMELCIASRGHVSMDLLCT